MSGDHPGQAPGASLERPAAAQAVYGADSQRTAEQAQRKIAELEQKLAEVRRVSEYDRQMRRAALNLMEDAVDARRAAQRESVERHRVEDELRDRDRRKDEFLAMLAHELRNPLASILNAAELLEFCDRPEQVLWSRDVLKRHVQHMGRLVDDLLDVARITTGKISLELGPTELTPIVSHAVETVRPFLEERHHQIEVEVAPEAEVVMADSIRLEQVLVNLLTNSIKFTPDHGHLTIRVVRVGDMAQIEVRDTGRGIPEHLLPRVFDLFVQGSRQIDRSEGGLGIGLTLVKKLVDLHNGTIRAESRGEGQGSVFTLWIPTAELPQSLGDEQETETNVPRQLRILIVDDNADMTLSLAKFLALSGHLTYTAFNGQEAIRLAHEIMPEVVLLDIGLPGLSGFDVATQLRQENYAGVIIAISGYCQESDRFRGREAGFDLHLAKPVDCRQLTDLIGKQVARAAGAAD